MKLPIPDDWDGQSWRCVQVQWPDSQQYMGVLLGLLSFLTRGRIWDENSGTIKSAQAIGWDIFDRAYPLVPCDDCPDCPDCPDTEPPGEICPTCGGSLIMEDIPVGQVVTDVQIVDGKIRVFYGPCCWHDLSGIDVTAGTDDSIDGPYVPPTGPDTTEYSACAKAWAVIDAIEKVLNSAYNAVFENIFPWQWPGFVENDLDMNLNDKWTTILIIDWMGLGIVVTPENAFTDEDQQKSAFALSQVFKNDRYGVPDDATYEAIKAAIHTRGLVYDGFIMTAIAALGRSNLDKIAQLGAKADETRLCGEEIDMSGATTPDASGWYLGPNLAGLFAAAEETSTSWDAYLALRTLEEDAFGTFLRIQSSPSDGTIKRMSESALEGLTYPVHDLNCWTNTSDHLESINQAYPLISTLTPTIRASLAAQLGYTANLDGGSGGLNGTTVATPPALAGQIVMANIFAAVLAAPSLQFIEFRFVHNTGSPSHA